MYISNENLSLQPININIRDRHTDKLIQINYRLDEPSQKNLSRPYSYNDRNTKF